MAEVKWIKLKTNMFDDEKIQLIDAMPERDTILYVWIRLLVQAGKTNADGYIYLSENVPYTDEMLSTLFRRPINSVRLALETLRKFGMIEISDNHFIKVVNWAKHQNAARLDEIREYSKLAKQKQRALKKAESVKDCPGHVLEKPLLDIDIDKDIDIELDKKESIEKKDDTLSPQAINLCKYYEQLKPGESISAHTEQIKVLIDMYGFDWCKEAMQKMVLNKGKFIPAYMEKILQSWQSEGKEDTNGADKRTNNKNKKDDGEITYDFSKYGG